MAEQIPDQKTQVSTAQVADALFGAWERYFGSRPSVESICVLLAQWGIETGFGKSMHCFNLGNVKSKEGDGRDYTFFACNEILSAPQAAKMVCSTAKITKDLGDGNVIIWFYPNHPGCRFRAFHTLSEGADDYLKLLVTRFATAWPSVVAGDPRGFSKALKKARYYTADEGQYTAGVVKIFDSLKGKIHLPDDTLTRQEREKVLASVAETLADISEELREYPSG